MRTFILLSSLPGSGKSTWAKQYAKDHPDTVIVSSDEIRLELGGSTANFDHEKEVWATFLKRIHEGAAKSEDVTVIADATNIYNKLRVYYANETKEFNKKILVQIPLPFDVCQKQNAQRKGERVVPLDAMKRMAEEFEEPSEEVLSLYDERIIVRRVVIK